MGLRFEELDWRETPIGAISLRRRLEPGTGREIHEVKLDDDFLMSSLFTAAEEELARVALAALPDRPLDVAVGGLGLGYTAATVLEDARVRELVVVDALPAVIDWHRRGLVPLGPRVAGDPRCRLVEGDFFALVAAGAGLDGGPAARTFDAVVLDVDHAPDHVLHPSHAPFYTRAGLTALTAHLRPDGVFALWSNDPPDATFLATLGEVFADVSAPVVAFDNPLQGRDATNTVYLARGAREAHA